MKQEDVRASITTLRYVPVVSFVLMFSHMILLHLGVDFPVSEILVVMCGYYLTYTFSRVFDFCILHRMMIYYAFTAMVCIWLRRFPDGEYGMFGKYIWIARGTMLAIGCIIFILLVVKKCKKARSHVNSEP